MSDVIRDYIDAPVDDEIVKRREDKVKALAALDAEREAHETLKMKYAMMEKFADDSVKRRAAETEEHAKEVAALNKQLDAMEDSPMWSVRADAKIKKLKQQSADLKQRITELEVVSSSESIQQPKADLKQRIEELEAQLQDDRKEPSHDWR